MYPTENSVPHLLWCILVALRTAEEDKPFSSESARRRFIADWLNMARSNPNFHGMASEFTTLRELLDKTKKTTSVTDILSTLLENAYAAEKCDLFRFRSAFNTLLQHGWKHTVCHHPENIIVELTDRREGDHRHILQLTHTGNAFHPVGKMIQPMTFHLLFSRKDAGLRDTERAFHREGFQVVCDKQKLCLTDNRIIRTLYIGLPSLPAPEWSPQQHDIWWPGNKPATPNYH